MHGLKLIIGLEEFLGIFPNASLDSYPEGKVWGRCNMGVVFQLIILVMGLSLFYGMGWSYLKALAPYQPLPAGTMRRSGRKIYLEGVYGPGKILQSPIAQESCVRWRVVVWEKEGKNSVNRLDHSSFADEDFCILRRGDRHQFAIKQQPDNTLKNINDLVLTGWKKPHHQYRQNMFSQNHSPQAINFLQANGITPQNRFGITRSLTIAELFWRSGDRVYVFGELEQRQGQWWIKADLLADQPLEKLRLVPSIFLLIGAIITFFSVLGLFTPLR